MTGTIRHEIESANNSRDKIRILPPATPNYIAIYWFRFHTY